MSALPATSLGSRGATLGGIVDTHGFETSWHFEYGPTSAYGSSTPTRTSAARILPVSVPITGLTPGTTYHFRLVASTSAGTDQTTDRTFTTPGAAEITTGAGGGSQTPPELARLAIHPAAIVAAPRGASIARRRKTGANVIYTDTAVAITTFIVQRAQPALRRCRTPSPRAHLRRRRRCTRYTQVGGFTHADSAGRDSFHFTGRVGGHKLRPGTYRLDASARVRSTTGPTVSVAFRIIR